MIQPYLQRIVSISSTLTLFLGLFFVDFFLYFVGHVFDGLEELLLEDHVDKWARHIKSLLTVVISVILHSSTKVSLDETVRHIPNEEGFLKFISFFYTYMGQKILFDNIPSIL